MATGIVRPTTRIVCAYLASDRSPPADVETVGQLVGPVAGAMRQARHAVPKRGAAVQRSITPEALISFEDGKPYKRLRRHLAARGLTPDQYRKKWGLPDDYPLVAANYSEAVARKRRTSASVVAKPR
jgi:predicted transcriptional regulator